MATLSRILSQMRLREFHAVQVIKVGFESWRCDGGPWFVSTRYTTMYLLEPMFYPPLKTRCIYWAQFEPLFLAPVGKAGSVGGMVAASRATGPEGSRRRPVSPNPAENSQAEKFRRKFRESATNTKAALRTLPLKHFDFKSVYVLCVF